MTDPAGRDVAVFIDPPSRHFEQDRLFDRSDERLNRDGALEPFAALRDRLRADGITVHTGDLIEAAQRRRSTNVYISCGIRERYKRLAQQEGVTLSAFFAFECPAVEPALYRELPEISRAFRRTFSFSDAASLTPFTPTPVPVQSFRLPQAVSAVERPRWERGDRRWLVMINANKRPALERDELYTERLRAVAFFGARGEIDLYGHGWGGAPYRMGTRRWLPGGVARVAHALAGRSPSVRRDRLLTAARRAWRGACTSKADTLSRYRFALAFENMRLAGWITEKMIDCLAVGTVPVYLGAPDIERAVPRECFIDAAAFDSYEDLRRFMRSRSDGDIDVYRDAGRAFLESDAYRPFTTAAFLERVTEIVQQDAAAAVGAPR